MPKSISADESAALERMASAGERWLEAKAAGHSTAVADEEVASRCVSFAAPSGVVAKRLAACVAP